MMATGMISRSAALMKLAKEHNAIVLEVFVNLPTDKLLVILEIAKFVQNIQWSLLLVW